MLLHAGAIYRDLLTDVPEGAEEIAHMIADRLRGSYGRCTRPTSPRPIFIDFGGPATAPTRNVITSCSPQLVALS